MTDEEILKEAWRQLLGGAESILEDDLHEDDSISFVDYQKISDKQWELLRMLKETHLG